MKWPRFRIRFGPPDRAEALEVLGITADDLAILRQLPSCIPDGVGLGDDIDGGRRWFYGFVARIDDGAPWTFQGLSRR